MQKRKIAVIGLKGLPAFGGAASVGENLINHLKSKYAFTVYASASHADSQIHLNGFHQIVFKVFPIKKLNVLYYYIVSALHAVLLSKYDLVHLHHRDAAFILLILKLRYRVITTTHQIFDLDDKWEKCWLYFILQEKLFLKLSDIVTCVSKKEKRFLREKYNINTFHIPNGINSPNEHDKTIDREAFLLFAANRILPTKGCHILLEALTRLDGNISLKIVGDTTQLSSYSNDLYNQSQNLSVDYLGLIKSKQKLFEILKSARFFIFPSTIEAMSMMLLEAASVRTPIICSNIVENTDIFNEDEVLYFKTGDSHDLAEKIDFALNHQGDMQEKAKNACRKLMKEYLWENIALRYEQLYEKLMKSTCNTSKRFLT